MQTIISTIKPGDRNQEVFNLQEALKYLISRNIIELSDQERNELTENLRLEQQKKSYGSTTGLLVVKFRVKHQLNDHSEVDAETAAAINKYLKEWGLLDEVKPPFVVRGTVRFTNGQPAPGLHVEAFDKDLRSEELLDRSLTDTDGKYEIPYTSEKFTRAEKGNADLLIRVKSNAGEEVASSINILFNAKAEETIDIIVNKQEVALSEYEQIIKDINPILQDIAIHELNQEDISFLAGDTGWPSEYLSRLSTSTKLSREANVPAEVFYGLFRQDLPSNLAELLSQDLSVLRRALETSSKEKIIPFVSDEQLDGIIIQLVKLKASQLLKPSGENMRASFGDLVRTVMPGLEKQNVLAELFVSHRGTSDEFWKTVSEKLEFSPEEVRQVRTTLDLGTLTGSHLPLVLELQTMGQADAAFQELRGFARLSETEWLELVNRPQIGFPPDILGVNDTEKKENYARTLNRFIETNFPTAVIAYRIQKDDRDDSPFKPMKADLNAFFTHNPMFELGVTPVDLYLTEDREKKLRDVNKPEDLTVQLKSMQRLFKITPYFDQISTLLADDLHSSQAIVRFGQNRFLEKYSQLFGGEQQAKLAYAKAEQIHDMALLLYARHSNQFNAITPYVIAGDSNGTFSQTTTGTSEAAWRTLFGSVDLCDCEHCKSVYSPAAYLVDILKFLSEGTKKNNRTPLQVLLDRRPDLGHIELTCENTNTMTPYVDLVNEVLENAVSPLGFSVAVALSDSAALFNDLNLKVIPASLIQDFANNGLILSGNATVGLDEKDKRWTIRDLGWRYTIRYDSTGILNVSAWPQTGGTDEELSANPEHVNPAAYVKLSEAVYPWNLPLNLWWEESRIYLNHLGVQRHELIETFLKRTLFASVLTDETLAREYLGLTPREAKIINDATTGGLIANPGPWNFWGLLQSGNTVADLSDPTAQPATGDWDTVLKRVSIFLQQSGLSYKELLELLGTYFINPVNNGTRKLNLVSTVLSEPATCNLSKLEIKGLDATFLDKIHRFVRLWHKLGWTMSDLDKTITALTTTDLNDDFLLQLSHIQRLRTSLNVPLVSMLSWWANIGTASYIDHLSEEQPKVAALYTQLFRNKAIINPVDQAFTEDAKALNGKISEHLPTILAALGISATDLTLLTTGTTAVVKDDNLTLSNLSLLYRTTSLAMALKLSIRDYLSVRSLTGIDPFAALPKTATEPLLPATGATLRFAEKVEVIRSSGFSIDELNYLLRHDYVASSGLVPTDQSISLVLNEIRSGLEKIVAENSFMSDPSGELTRKKLEITKQAIQWEDADINHAISLLDGTAIYEEPLASTSTLTVSIPSTVNGKISYDTAAQTLRWVGAMSVGEKSLLLSFSTDEKYREAIEKLFNDNTGSQTKTVPLTNIPSLAISESGPAKIIYDRQTKKLRFTSVMTLAEKTLLTEVGIDKTATENLFQQPRSVVSGKMKNFLDPADFITTLLNQESSKGKKFNYFLNRLLAYVRPFLNKTLVKQKLGEALKLETNLMELLLERFLHSPLDVNKLAISDFLELPDGGLSVTYFNNQDLAGATVKRIDPEINFNWNGRAPDPVITNGTFSARWTGKVQSEKSETYTFFTNTDDGVRLWVGNQLLIDQWHDQSATEYNGTISLKAGQLYDIKMEYYQNGSDAVTELRWSSPSTPKEIISAGFLFPDTTVQTYRLLHKIARFVSAFKISDEELAYLSSQAADQKWLDMTLLPLTETASSSMLFAAWERLVDLFRFRDSFPSGKINLFSIFKQAANPNATKAGLIKLIYELTGWNLSDLEFLAGIQNPGDHFYTSSAVERNNAIGKLSYLGEGIACNVFGSQVSGTTPLYRLFHQKTGDHFYTTSVAERNAAQPAYSDEGIACYVFDTQVSGTTPLYRLFHQKTGDHFYTTSVAERDAVQPTYKYEGVACYVFDSKVSGTTPLYRLVQSKTGFSFPDAYLDERALVRLQACFKLIKRLGASAEQISNWSKPNQTTAEEIDNARSIKNAVKAKYDDKQWLEVAKPLRDQLREKQRMALVSYLMAERKVTDANELYEVFLLDVEMSPCMKTTRIKQAISSAQLFIQRCLMNLEPGVTLRVEEAKQWSQWRKQYRIWEANRKVFLYPENWIEPELRDDKSPFFKDLENELLQNDVTMDTAETAFLHYLEKLDEVARLEIVGMYQQKEAATDKEKAIDILHVFGRTFTIPHIYYYRKLENSTWSAWEKVDLDIEGDHLIPVVWNRRLFLFWPLFIEKETEGLAIGANSEIPVYPKPATKWEIQLAWSSYKNDKWAPKKISAEKITISPNAKKVYNGITEVWMYKPVEKTGIVFKTRIDGNSGDLIMILKYIEQTSDESLIWKSFKLLSAGTKVSVGDSGIDPKKTEFKPPDSHLEFMSFVENEGVHRLSLLVGEVEERHDIEGWLKLGTLKHIPTLGMTGEPEHQPNTFRILYPHQFWDFFTQSSFFYQDNTRTFFVSPLDIWEKATSNSRVTNITVLQGQTLKTYYEFLIFYHPYVSEFIKQLNRYGIEGLLDPKPDGVIPKLRRQLITKDFFKTAYDPEFLTVKAEFIWERPEKKLAEPYPKEDVNFSDDGAYSLYNWELFFHTPFLIATRLSKNQRFDEARKWFHYIFDPTTGETGGPDRFWKVKPFYEHAKSPPKTLTDLLQDAADLQKQVEAWQNNPFKPHVVARLRIVAYMKAVVMKYIDNLIAWGDQLFRRDTIESINEATQLYILAAQILGRRPEKIPLRAFSEVQTFNSIELINQKDKLSEFLVGLVNVESYVIPSGAPNVNSPGGTSSLGTMPLFYITKNDKLLGYWDTVTDRIFKIRHCMNIEGVVRQLPLFEPPIDPALLVRAAAAGADINSALSDINAALPYYRFNVMMQKAIELCNDVKALGGALLSALERRDVEALTLLRSGHEIKLLNAVRDIKKQQIKEMDDNLQGLKRSKEIVGIRHDYYTNIAFMNPQEIAHLSGMEAASLVRGEGVIFQRLAQAATIIPNFNLGASGMSSPVVTAALGGPAIAAGLTAMGMAKAETSNQYLDFATRSQIIGNYNRRSDDWNLQKRLAAKELEQLDRQITAAEIRVTIAEYELKNHDLQIESFKEVDAFMREKYTNQEIYDWMIGQISGIYFQSYQLAYDVAKRAERCFRYELDLSDSNYIQFGYWDSLKKGLLSGDRLYYDLKRMEVAYLDLNKREFELTKHVSIAALNPLSLLQLKETGKCIVSLPEELFDLDYQGHYFRRIKSVSISIPCVAGPYTTINCTLRLLKSSIRTKTSTNGYGRDLSNDDNRFRDDYVLQSIATSSSQNDSGLFELNFRDERYVPFEGKGVVSDWSIELTEEKKFRQFDYDTISDVIIHIRYTAREDAGDFKNSIVNHLKTAITNFANSGMPLRRLFDVKHEFPIEFHEHKSAPTSPADLIFEIDKARFPFFVQETNNLKVKAIDIVSDKDLATSTLKIKSISVDEAETLPAPASIGHLNLYSLSGLDIAIEKTQFTFTIDKTIEEFFVILTYEVA